MSSNLALLLLLAGSVASWDTSYDNEFTYTCPNRQHLYRIQSHHDNGREDRVWNFYCRNSGAVSSSGCSWTGYLNQMDAAIDFTCPSGKIMTGLHSYHSNHQEDRRWKVRCCNQATPLSGCYWNSYANGWDGDMDYSVSSNQVIVGTRSYHDNGKEDRRYRFQKCNKKVINGNWGSFGSYTGCTKNCGGGSKSRSRSCNNPAPLNGGSYCAGGTGNARQTTSCNNQACPIDGKWSGYGAYSKCSKPCASGTQSRTRTCSKPAPQHGGKNCAGNAKQTIACNTQKCPIDGKWSAYGAYSKCSKDCGGGTKTRKRTCSNPIPQYNGKNCVGDDKQTIACNTQHCPINGKWSQWTPFSQCSKDCGGGEEERSRTCNDPKPQHGGKECVGKGTDTKVCNTKACPIDGEWAKWSPYTACTKECGGGEKQRSRACSAPQPLHGGKACVGDDTQKEACNEQACLPLPHWPSDFKWSSAGQPAGFDCIQILENADPNSWKDNYLCWKKGFSNPGIKWKSSGKIADMRCTKIEEGADKHTWDDNYLCVPQNSPYKFRWANSNTGKASLVGDGESCIQWLEPKDPDTWTDNYLCGEAPVCKTLLTTAEKNPVKDTQCVFPFRFQGKDYDRCTRAHTAGKWAVPWCATQVDAAGNYIDGKWGACDESACSVAPDTRIHGEWSAWKPWSKCSKDCGGGDQSRRRACDNPAPKNNGKECVGEASEQQECNKQPCAVDGEWSKWTPYTTCSKECGGGSQERTRACDDPKPQHGGVECSGIRRELKKCNTETCPCNIDMALVLDASFSQSHKEGVQSGWEKQVAFAENFVKKAPKGLMVSVMVYSEVAVVKHPFTKNHAELSKFMSTLAAPGYTSRIDLALKAVEDEAFTESNGARADAKKKVVLASDGDQTTRRLVPSEVNPVPIAKRLRDSGIDIDCVAFKDFQGKIDHKELEDVAGGKKDVFVFGAGGAEALQSHLTKECKSADAPTNYRVVER